MAKYTDNLIPEMTSNTTPSGVAIANSQSLDDYYMPACNAFNSKKGNWGTEKGINVGWLQYKFSYPVKINKYIIMGSYSSGLENNNLDKCPNTWTFEGFNGSSWKILDTRTGETN